MVHALVVRKHNLPTEAPPPAAQRPRLDWIDLAKAISILLVVLNHTLTYTLSLEWSRQSAAAPFWEAVAVFCMPLRLPLFFFATGLLAAPSLTTSRSDALRKRIVSPLWLYLVWAAIFALAIPRWPMPGASELPLGMQLARMAAGTSLAWYLWALPVLFAYGRLTKNRGAAWLMLMAALLALLPIEHLYSGNILRCLFFYLAGLRLPSIAHWIARNAGFKAIAAAIAGGAIAAFSGVQLALDVAGVAALSFGCALAVRHSGTVRRSGRWLAERTLPIYVLHFPLLTVGAFGLTDLASSELLGMEGFAAASPLLLGAAVVLVALVLHRLAMATPLRVLFITPAIVEAAAERALARIYPPAPADEVPSQSPIISTNTKARKVPPRNSIQLQ